MRLGTKSAHGLGGTCPSVTRKETRQTENLSVRYSVYRGGTQSKPGRLRQRVKCQDTDERTRGTQMNERAVAY